MGYFKIKQCVFQQNLSGNFRFEWADVLCKYCEKGKKETDDKYQCLDNDDKRKNISDKDILENM